ncbi:hypothetical protein [Nostoc sp.]|uniref:hypothetical protein n=1 Tax=Nostoc sp. TaxID=1180 RepID=UPI002FF5AC2D
MAEFSVTDTTRVIQIQGCRSYARRRHRSNGSFTIVTVRLNCNSSSFVFTTSDRSLVCY